MVIPNLDAYKGKDWPLKNKEWAAMVTWLDQCVGEIVALLRDLKLEENTLILFASDNGYSQWGYFARPKWTDDPLFKNKGPWPGGKFALYDVMPTLAELAGAPQPQTDCISFAPELLGKSEAQKKHDYLYWENGTMLPQGQAARLGRWYVMCEHPDKPLHVFDVEQDPGCTNDVGTERSDLVTRGKAVFAEAHTDSAWYLNPR